MRDSKNVPARSHFNTCLYANNFALHLFSQEFWFLILFGRVRGTSPSLSLLESLVVCAKVMLPSQQPLLQMPRL